MSQKIRGEDQYDLALSNVIAQLNIVGEGEWGDLDELLSHANGLTDEEVLKETEVSLISNKVDLWVGPDRQNISAVARMVVWQCASSGNLLPEERSILEHFMAISILT